VIKLKKYHHLSQSLGSNIFPASLILKWKIKILPPVTHRVGSGLGYLSKWSIFYQIYHSSNKQSRVGILPWRKVFFQHSRKTRKNVVFTALPLAVVQQNLMLIKQDSKL